MEYKIVIKEDFKVIGMEGKTSCEDAKVKIPEIWKAFMPRSEEIKNRVNDKVFYGVCEYDPAMKDNCNCCGEFTELVCVEANSLDVIPEGMVGRVIPAAKYAVFTHKGPLANLPETYNYIYGPWKKDSDYEMAEADVFEYYDERFCCCHEENSEFDIYIPIKN